MSAWVLLRGWAREARHWGDFVPQLAAVMAPERVMALDLPGAGERRAEASPLAVPSIADRCREALAARGLPPPYSLFGQSLGGMVAMDWATRYPAQIERCVLLSTSARPFCAFHERLQWRRHFAIACALFTSDHSRRERAILALVSSNEQRRAEAHASWTRYAEQGPVSRANALRQLLAAARYRAPARAPAAPVLLLAGRGDRLVHRRCSENLARAWHVPLRTHPSAGHDLALDAPGWVAQEVQLWLRGAGPAR